jgi:hypothetical protein
MYILLSFQSNDDIDPIVRIDRLLRTQFKSTNREQIILEAFDQLTKRTTTRNIHKQISELFIQRQDYIRLIQLITQDFPIQFKDKIPHQIVTSIHEDSPVRYKEFHRGIEICLLFDGILCIYS